MSLEHCLFVFFFEKKYIELQQIYSAVLFRIWLIVCTINGDFFSIVDCNLDFRLRVAAGPVEICFLSLGGFDKRAHFFFKLLNFLWRQFFQLSGKQRHQRRARLVQFCEEIIGLELRLWSKLWSRL